MSYFEQNWALKPCEMGILYERHLYYTSDSL